MISLTTEESALYDCVLEFDLGSNDFEKNKKAVETAGLLMNLLIKRKAIPETRIKYFVKSEYQFGNLKRSRKDVFESNNIIGRDIFKRPQFLKYLHYFINGAEVSEEIQDMAQLIFDENDFQDEAMSKLYDFLKSSQLIPKVKVAKDKFADEIFKLATDLGFDADYCHFVRRKIKL